MIKILDKLRNNRISRKRAPGERLFAVIKTVFKAGHTMVTTVNRAGVKMVFACFMVQPLSTTDPQETAQLRCTEPHTPCAEMVLDSRLR